MSRVRWEEQEHPVQGGAGVVLSFEEFSMTYVTIYDIHHTWQRRQRRRCWALSTECLNALFMPPDNLFKAMAMDERSSRGT